MKLFSPWIIIIFNIFLWSPSTVLPTIVAGSSITVIDGLIPIESLQPNDCVISLCTDASFSQTQIISLAKKETHTIYKIVIDKGTLSAAHDQLLYDPNRNAWIKAQNITTETYLLDADLNYWQCRSIEKQEITSTAYELSLDSPHTFFFSDLQILTHNIFPFTLGLVIAFGMGEGVALETITVGIGALGIGVYKIFNHKKRHVELTLDLNKIGSNNTTENAKPQVNDHCPQKTSANDTTPNENVKPTAIPTKTAEDLIKDLPQADKKKSSTKIYSKPGGFSQALEDFESLNPENVKIIENGHAGKYGTLPDGRPANVRSGCSGESQPTLEIQSPASNKVIKIRYTE